MQVPVAAITLKSLLKLMPFKSVERIEIDTQASRVIAAASPNSNPDRQMQRQSLSQPKKRCISLFVAPIVRECAGL